ncbi:MAG TPA: hypothetical protein VFL79_03005 [Terriglobia bacterium]|nr:hypothetical protein [Terriglobia bacterium]
MKTLWLILAALCLLLAESAIAGNAWTTVSTTYVPFDFVVNGQTLPAGNYAVRTHDMGRRLLIQNLDEPEYVTTVTNNNIWLSPSVRPERSNFIFNLNNGQHVLHQIYIASNDHTHDIFHGNEVAELVATR